MDKLEVIDKNSDKMLKASKQIRSFIEKLVDEASFVETDVFMAGPTYVDGTEALGEGVVTGFAYITGSPVCIIAQNYEVLKGSLSVTHANKIEKTLSRALQTKCPVISIISSNGARLGEGVAVLEGYSKIIRKANELKGNVPHICVVDGPAVGLMSSYVNTADFVFINSKKGYVSVNAPQVLLAKAKTYKDAAVELGKELVKNSLVATNVYDTVDEVCNDVYKLIELLYDGEREDITDDPNRLTPALNKGVTVEKLLKAVYDNGKYMTFYDDYAKEVVVALGIVNGVTCGIVANRSTENDGFISKNGLQKINEFVYKLDSLQIPLITLVDSKGINSNLAEEQEGLSKVCADLLSNISLSNNAKVSVITGNAVGFAYSALASKSIGFDYTLAFVDSYVSPLNADTAIEVLAEEDIKKASDPVKAREALQKAYVTDAANPYVTAKEGFIDNVIEPAVIRPYIISILNILMGY